MKEKLARIICCITIILLVVATGCVAPPKDNKTSSTTGNFFNPGQTPPAPDATATPNYVTEVTPFVTATSVSDPTTTGTATLITTAMGEVWVDDDWAGSSPGDPVDGHTFGYDAFANIQEAIDAVASPGHVHVAGGTYYENIVLKDGVQLLGAGAEVTTIDGGGAGSVVTKNVPEYGIAVGVPAKVIKMRGDSA